MPFPTIPTGTRIVTGLDTVGGATKTFPSLTGLTKNAGDLLIAICITYDGNSTNAEFSSWGGGFTEFHDSAGTTTMGIGCAYKWSTGAETGTFTVTAVDASTSDSAFLLLSIPGAHNTTIPEAGSRADGTTAAANPASFDPAGWDVEDTLWIAVGASGEDALTGSYTGIASAPANYTDYRDTGMSADAIGAVEGAVAFRLASTASEDVGAFSVDVSNARNSAIVIAVRSPVVTYIREPGKSFPPGRKMPRALASARYFGDVAVGPQTYEKTGVLVPYTTLAGTDVFEASEVGSLVAGSRLAGLDAFTAAETGALTASALLSGADVFTASEVGSLTSAALLSGVRVITYNRAGSLKASGLLSGVRVLTYNRAGALTSVGLLSGADVFTASETGALVTAGLLSGADAFTASETGALTPVARLAGADAFTASETGSLVAAGLLSGVRVITYNRAGSLTAVSLLAGADVFTASETGALMATSLLSGVAVKQLGVYEKTGALIAAALLSGVDVFTATEMGSLSANGFASGADSFQASETGALIVRTLLAGVSALGAPVVIVLGHFDEPTPAINGLDEPTIAAALFDRASPAAASLDEPTPSRNGFDEPSPAGAFFDEPTPS